MEEEKNKDRDRDAREARIARLVDVIEQPFPCIIRVLYEKIDSEASSEIDITVQFATWAQFEDKSDDIEMFKEFMDVFHAKAGEDAIICNTEPLEDKFPPADCTPDVVLPAPKKPRPSLGQITSVHVDKKGKKTTKTFLTHADWSKEKNKPEST
jgi:hypothetical protein